MRFLFQILLRAKTIIKHRYVNIGWLVEGLNRYIFLLTIQMKGRQNVRGEAKGIGKKI